MLLRINVHPVDHLYYCLELCPNSVHSHSHDCTQREMLKKQLLQYTFVNTCTFHNPFQFLYNSNGLEQTHSGYFRSFCSQFTIIVQSILPYRSPQINGHLCLMVTLRPAQLILLYNLTLFNGHLSNAANGHLFHA